MIGSATMLNLKVNGILSIFIWYVSLSDKSIKEKIASMKILLMIIVIMLALSSSALESKESVFSKKQMHEILEKYYLFELGYLESGIIDEKYDLRKIDTSIIRKNKDSIYGYFQKLKIVDSVRCDITSIFIDSVSSSKSNLYFTRYFHYCDYLVTDDSSSGWITKCANPPPNSLFIFTSQGKLYDFSSGVNASSIQNLFENEIGGFADVNNAYRFAKALIQDKSNPHRIIEDEIYNKYKNIPGVYLPIIKKIEASIIIKFLQIDYNGDTRIIHSFVFKENGEIDYECEIDGDFLKGRYLDVYADKIKYFGEGILGE
jgi:hypothetical protein